MSEFDCRKWHGPFASHEIRNGRCPVCNGRIVYMDGMSDRELTAMEQDWKFDTQERSDDGESTDNNG